MRSSSIWPENSASAASLSSSSQLVPPPMCPSSHQSSSRQSNVSRLLARREVSPRTKRAPKRFWNKASSHCIDSSGIKSESTKDARQELLSWVESESLLHLSAKYCPLLPPPRSTIAAAFSPDGKTLASTQFHPLYPEVLASGSLDHEVRLWDAKTAECIGSHRPIASIAFHAHGEILAVASGHKLYIWHYNRRGEASSPSIILKTRRSLRAVHFHPHSAPFLLTAEVNDLDSSDPSMTLATSPGYSRYPPPTIYLADAHSIPFLVWPSTGRGDRTLPSQQSDVGMSSSALQQRVDSSPSVRVFTYSNQPGQYELVTSPVESPVRDESQHISVTREMENSVSEPAVDAMETDVQAEERSFFPFRDPAYWDIPFLQGWLMGQSQAGQLAMHSHNGGTAEGLSLGNPTSVVPPVIHNNVVNSRVSGRSGSRQRISRSRTVAATGSGDGAAFNSIPPEQSNSQPFMSQVQSEVATSLAAAAAAELPCTVKLRIWSHDVKNPCAHLSTDRCRLTIPHAVLCSEMGAHFSPCGRFLAVCVACILPNMDTDLGFQSQVLHDVTGVSTSPTRHPISAHQVIYELRVYSLEKATFGSVLASRAIRAAHCLTSIQFSPTSEHLLLAYGRRHSSLLKSVVIDGDTTVPIYTILEIYRVSDMELVRVLPSAEDEVNVACFHPSVGGGLVYGTKEGKLRILQCNISHSFNNEGSCVPDDNMFEKSASARRWMSIDSGPSPNISNEESTSSTSIASVTPPLCSSASPKQQAVMANVGFHTTTFLLLHNHNHNHNHNQHHCYLNCHRRPLFQPTTVLSPPLHLCRSRLWDSNAEPQRTNSFNFNTNDNDDDDDDESMEQWAEALEDYIDSMWILKVFRSYGWMLPPILLSMLLATGPKAFLMALALPIGQSTFAFAFQKMQENGKNKPKPKTRKTKKRRSRPYSPRNAKSEEEAEWVSSLEARMKKKEYQSWVSNNNNVSVSSSDRSKADFGGWDELDSGGMGSNLRSTRRPTRKTSGHKGRPVKKTSNLYSGLSKTSTPLLLRFLISIFPFLEFME
ncbi:hypothetical protein ACJIZ3_017120 [Penstemon smallii]|uniref:Uncharacterized protein n=1 Tax=Penstemon smallii TaxID=265156 RepID=A0ABD3SVU3_9LAMI